MDTKSYQGNNFASLGDWTGQCPGSVDGWQDGYFNVALTSNYDRDTQGDVTIRVTNTLDQGAGDESIAYGDMELDYDYDPDMPWDKPEIVNIDEGLEEDPTGGWQNNCNDWTTRQCVGHYYWGGQGQCGKDHMVWRDIEMSKYPGANRISFSGKFWAVDSWDGETARMEIVDEHGNVLDQWETQCVHGHTTADMNFNDGECEHMNPGWGAGWYAVEMSAPYEPSMGVVTIRVSNTLDENLDNESFAVSDFKVTINVPGSTVKCVPAPEPMPSCVP
jgi:hypothetical protein